MQTARHQAQRERFTALLNSRLVFAADAGQGSDHARAVTMLFHGNHPLTPSFHSHAALQEGELPVDRWVERTRGYRARPLPRYLRRMSIAASDFRKLVQHLGSTVFTF